MGDPPSEVRPARTSIVMNSEALTRAVAAYDEARCAVHGPFEKPMSDRNRETIAPMILAAVEAHNAVANKEAKEALAWIAAFAAMRAKDDSKVFAKVCRGAFRAVSDRARSVLENDSARLADATNNPPSDPGTEQREAGV